MKKIISIALLFSFVVTTLGVFPVFKLFQSGIRHQVKMRIKQGVPETDLHIITFSSSDTPEWVREGKEFRLNDKLFDIVKTEYNNGQIIYLCVDDEDEARLFNNLDELVKEQSGNSGLMHNVKRLLQSLFQVNIVSGESPICCAQWLSSELYFLYEFAVKTAHSEPPVPPPDLG